MQILTNVLWDAALTDVELIESNAFTRQAGIAGLVLKAIKMTTGAPAATPGKFIPGAFVQNSVSGVIYQNTGSTASPTWTSIGSGSPGPTGPTGPTGPSGSGATGPTGPTGPNIGSGVNFGPAGVASITVVNGIITAIS